MDLFTSLVLILLTATLGVAVTRRLGQPSLLGFLLTGLILGPLGLGLVNKANDIEMMAELGVVLLLFTIGLEISLRSLWAMARLVFGGGLFQLVATGALVSLVFSLAGLSSNRALTMGLLVATSSTALVLRLLGDRGELGTRYGRLSLAILLMQDFAVVGLMLVLPMLAAASPEVGALWIKIGKALGLTAALFVFGRFGLPWVLKRLARLRSREVFLLMTLGIVFSTAWLAHWAGMSLALGAFIAGLVISESDYSHQMFAEVMPFRDVFNGLFFVSVGLLIRPEVLAARPWLILGGVAAVLLLKGLVVVGVARLARLPWGEAVLSGLALAQIGEFGLVLGTQAERQRLLTAEEHSLFVTVAVVTMALTPALLALGKRLVGPASPAVDPALAEVPVHTLRDHVIIVGYGLNGRNVARALGGLEIPFLAVELNPSTVEIERAAGAPIVYGDATRSALLHHLNISQARALVCVVADLATTREVVRNARDACPSLFVVARTRYVAEIEPLRDLGADVVVPEEFETSIELVGRLMAAYGAPPLAIQREQQQLRLGQYQALIAPEATAPPPTLLELLGALETGRIRVEAGSLACGQSLAGLNLRVATGATVLRVERADAVILAPSGEQVLAADDLLVLAGSSEALARAAALAEAPAASA